MAEETSKQPESEADPQSSAVTAEAEVTEAGAAVGEDGSRALPQRLLRFVSSRWKLVGIAASLLVLLTIYLMSGSSEPEKTPQEILAESLELLGDREDPKSPRAWRLASSRP